jgi:AcrR family transcriptional regulator
VCSFDRAALQTQNSRKRVAGDDEMDLKPAKTGRSRKRNRAAKQRTLLRAATRLFAARGYEATTTREIATRAGCAEGLIHRYFGGKSGLLLALMQSHGLLMTSPSGERLPAAEDVATEIRQIIQQELQRYSTHRDFTRVVVARALFDRRSGQFLWNVGPGHEVTAIVRRLQWHRENGQIPRDKGLDAVAHVLCSLGFALGFMGQLVFGHSHKRMMGLVDEIAVTLSRGLLQS